MRNYLDATDPIPLFIENRILPKGVDRQAVLSAIPYLHMTLSIKGVNLV